MFETIKIDGTSYYEASRTFSVQDERLFEFDCMLGGSPLHVGVRLKKGEPGKPQPIKWEATPTILTFTLEGWGNPIGTTLPQMMPIGRINHNPIVPEPPGLPSNFFVQANVQTNGLANLVTIFFYLQVA